MGKHQRKPWLEGKSSVSIYGTVLLRTDMQRNPFFKLVLLWRLAEALRCDGWERTPKQATESLGKLVRERGMEAGRRIWPFKTSSQEVD